MDPLEMTSRIHKLRSGGEIAGESVGKLGPRRVDEAVVAGVDFDVTGVVGMVGHLLISII